MSTNLTVLMVIGTLLGFSQGNVLKVVNESSRCGDWIPYKDEKCFKIVSAAGPHTQEDAEVICRSFKEELRSEYYPRLITITTKEEQEFFQSVLFDEYKILDHVWLGLKQLDNGDGFDWGDGTKLLFTNFAEQNVTEGIHRCVEMESGEGTNEVGDWVKVHCDKQNAVVCERMQTWTLESMQILFLGYKFEQGLEIKALKQKNAEAESEIANLKQRDAAAENEIAILKQRDAAAENEIAILKQNPVPIGFIYVQLANQPAPATLWPQATWADISATYAGLFFRVAGGTAAPLEEIQEASTSRLEQIEHVTAVTGQIECVAAAETLPADGSWTKNILTGREQGANDICLKFHVSAVEVKPRNQAMVVWQRSA